MLVVLLGINTCFLWCKAEKFNTVYTGEGIVLALAWKG